MKELAVLAMLFAPALCPLALADAATPATPAPAAPAPDASAPLAQRLRSALDELERTQSADCHGAASLVLAESGDPTHFARLMEEASQAGSAAATAWLAPLELAKLNAAGANMETDSRATELRARVMAAAAKGYAPAQVLASRLAGLGIGAAADEALAMRLLMQACKLGDPQARAAYLLASGRLQKGGIKAPEVASELKRNNFYLEELIAQGMGDTEEGVQWMQKARTHGSALAPYMLTQSNTAALAEAEAIACLEQAVERHHLDAMAFFAKVKLNANELREETGLALTEDREGGIQLLKLAASLGHPVAAQELATLCAQGMAGDTDLPVEQICALYRMAAELGEPNAMAGYGYCLLTGRGCQQDAVQGEAMLRKALAKNALWGNLALASAYFNGFGVKPDMRRATSALGEDAAMGSVHAYAIMAAITALGNEGTAPDPLRARIYLDMAKAEDPAAQAVYDAILTNKGWRFLPLLWK